MAYSAVEIDHMRLCTAILIDPLKDEWTAEWMLERSAVIEDRLRTHIAAGVSCADLSKHVEKELRNAIVAKENTRLVMAAHASGA